MHTDAHTFFAVALDDVFAHTLPSPPHAVLAVHVVPSKSVRAYGCACGSLSMPLTPMNAVSFGGAFIARRMSSHVTGLMFDASSLPASGHRIASIASAPWVVHVYDVDVTISMLTSS